MACRSYSIRKRLNEITGNLYEEKTFTANSGVEAKRLKICPSFPNKARKLNNKEIRFITVARLEPLKNIDINISVVSGMNLDYSYIIIGDGLYAVTWNGRFKPATFPDRIRIS